MMACKTVVGRSNAYFPGFFTAPPITTGVTLRLQRHNYGRVLELRFVEGLQSTLKVSNRSAARSDLSNEGQVNFSVGLDRLRLAQFSGPRETHLDHIPRRQCHRHPSQRLIRKAGGNSSLATGKGQKNEKKKASADSKTALSPLRETYFHRVGSGASVKFECIKFLTAEAIKVIGRG